MLSGSRYFVISAIFVLILVIFMAFNPGVYTTALGGDSAEQMPRVSGTVLSAATVRDDLRFSVVAGPEDSFGNAVLNIFFTLDTLRCPYDIYDSVASFSSRQNPKPHTLIIAVDRISGDEAELLRGFLARGGSVVFAVMPSEKSLASATLREMLGILELRAEYSIVGIELYDEFLITGALTLETIEFPCFELLLDGTCRVYATGINPERDMEEPYIGREDKRPLIWRTYCEGGLVYVMNAPFMERKAGLGMLTALIAMTNDDFIYPIVGARMFILESFPYIADHTKMVGNRSVSGFMRDIMLPDLVSFSTTMNIVFTCYTNGNFGKNQESLDVLDFFTEQIYRAARGEVSYAINADPAVYRDDLSRLAARTGITTNSYLRQNGAERAIPPPGTTMLLTREGELDGMDWISDSAAQAPIISEGLSDEAVLDAVGVLSFMGLMIHSVDMAVPIENEEMNSAWNVYIVELFACLNNMNTITDFLPSMTVSDATGAIKNYLNTDYVVERSDSGLNVLMDGNIIEMMFVLRTKREIIECINCTADEIQDDVYIVQSSNSAFEITLGE